MSPLIQSLRAGLSLVILFSLLLGGVYPLLVMSMAQTLFHGHANGSLIERGDKVLGSHLLGQQFESPNYFWGRLSALAQPYQADNSGGSNFSPNNPKAIEQAQARIAALQKADPRNKARIPVDLVTASGSGLDPHISLEAALYQLPRVARARGMKEQEVRTLVEKNAHSVLFGFLGDAYVNVVALNLALDDITRQSR